MKKIYSLFLLLSLSLQAQHYKIIGHFPELKNSRLRLTGFGAFKDSIMAEASLDDSGRFVLEYSKNYSGAARLQVENGPTLNLILHQENFEFQWDRLDDFSALKFKNSPENEEISKSMALQQQTNAKLSGLYYLKTLYKGQRLDVIVKEIKRQEKELLQLPGKMPKESYASYYIKIRQLLDEIALAGNYKEKFVPIQERFNSLDFSDPKLHHSGLMAVILENYFQLLAADKDADKVDSATFKSIDAVLQSQSVNSQWQQETATQLFSSFEKRSQSFAAEYVARKMLDQTSCILSEKSTNLFEQYRKMAVGNTAPDIVFAEKHLYDLKNAYKLIVFGASWCPNCQEEYPKLKESYAAYHLIKDFEVLYISIDTDALEYRNFYKDAPFVTFCDTKGWETAAAKDYYVAATPTLYVLDRDNKIVLKPHSIADFESWVKNK